MEHQRILRTVDANINRVSEGLRVLEDIARFIIEDPASSKQLKSIRHQLRKSAAATSIDLLKTRDVTGDIGAGTDFTTSHQDLLSVARANSRRVAEGLRVLEELAKLPELKTDLSADKLKESRYKIYSIEKTIADRLLEIGKPDTRNRENKNGHSKKKNK